MARVKKKAHEKLTEANIKHVISLLEGSPGITKKEACSILNISYSTPRLTKIIDEYKSNLEYRTRKKAEKRGTPVTKEEIKLVVEYYLEGEAIGDIAKRIFRSPNFCKTIVENLGVPLRVSGEEKLSTELLPEQCVAEEFSQGEVAWAANYHSSCEIKEKLPDRYNTLYNTNCYKVWIRQKIGEESKYFGFIEKGGFNAFIPAYDLGKLSHLKEYGVNIDNL